MYKKKYLNKKDIEKFDYRKLRITNHYLYKSEEEQEQIDKKLHKKNRLKIQQEMM